MKKKPLFPKHVTCVSQTDFLRNFRCRYYDSCMAKATIQNCFLSCVLCGFRFYRG